MDIEFFGRLVFIAAGALIIIVLTLPRLRFPREPSVKPPNFITLFLAVLCIGVGTFGQEFMPRYARLFKIIAAMVENPGQQTYASFFDSVGRQKIPVELQKIGIDYAVSHPVEGMEKILNNSIDKAPKNTEGEKALKWALESYKGKQKVIDHLVESKLDVASVKNFDPATRKLIYDKMVKLPDAEKRKLAIDVNLLRETGSY
jgi:hypothetical protein